MAEDYHLDQSDGKRYSMDPGESAFGSISSSYSPKSYGFRSSQQFTNGSASMSMCRQSATSPSTFPESNRTGEKSQKDEKPKIPSVFLSLLYVNVCSFVPPGGYSAASESQDSKAPSNKDPTTWSVDDVVWFIRDADPQALGPHSDVFRKHVSLFPIVFLTGRFTARSMNVQWTSPRLVATQTSHFCFPAGDRRERFVTPEERHDHEVPRTEAGSGLEALLPHRQTKAD